MIFQAHSGSKTSPPVSGDGNRPWAVGEAGRLCVHALLSFALVCLVGCRTSGPPTSNGAIPARRPNFVFILTDDQRFDSLGCAGNRFIQTPNIDRLAANGVRFRNHFVTTSICCVSRASIFTGQYERRHGIGDFTTPLTTVQWTETYPAPAMFQQTMRDHYRLVSGIDREVGRIVAKLAERGLADHTVLIFTSDNGWFASERGLADKWLMYEESIRVPLVVFDPRLPRSKRGRTVDALTLNLDFAPTMLEMASVSVPADMQGRCLSQLLPGSRPADWRKDFFYEHHYDPKIIPPSEGIRTERWAYLRWLAPNPESEELYDIQSEEADWVIYQACVSLNPPSTPSSKDA